MFSYKNFIFRVIQFNLTPINFKIQENLQMQVETDQQLIQSEQQLLKEFIAMQKKCIMIENYEDPGMTVQQIIQRMILLENSIKNLQIFSPNQSLKQVHTQYIRLLALPYHLGYLFGKISENRKQSVLQSKNYLQAYLNLCKHFNQNQEQELFPTNVFKNWKQFQQQENFSMQRDNIIAQEKQKIEIRKRYENAQKAKEESDQRQFLIDFLSLQIYEAFAQLRSIKQEIQILDYKDKIINDTEFKEKHEQEQSKPIPKMKVWNIKKPEQISDAMMPCIHQQADFGRKKQQEIAKVWQQNPNKPTMTLDQVGQLQYQNAKARSQREAKQRQANKQDSDSDKEQVDVRKKKKADNWDLFKEHNEKGAGNKNR